MYFCPAAQLVRWFILLPIVQALADPASTPDSEASIITYLDNRSENFFLRILPLGGSITLGWGSSTGNGFRKPLRDQLRKDGWDVNMVGTKCGGTNAPITGQAMEDNSVEAVAGFRVDQIQGILQGSLKYLPNVVVVNAGVTDCTPNYDIGHVGDRMNSLLDDIYNNIAETTVLLSTLIPSVDASVASCHESVNSQYRNIVSARSAQGHKIVLAEMAPEGPYWNTSVGGDYFDPTHPNDSGHTKMASIWYEAFQSAYSKGWITAPAVTAAVDDTASDSTCTKQAINSQSSRLGLSPAVAGVVVCIYSMVILRATASSLATGQDRKSPRELKGHANPDGTRTKPEAEPEPEPKTASLKMAFMNWTS